MVLETPTGQRILAMETRLDELLLRYTDEHPSVKELETRLRAADAEREAKTDEIIRRNLQARQKSFAYEMERYRTLLEEMEEEADEQDGTLRELASQQSEYEGMVTRREHLEALRDGDQQLIKEIQILRVREDAQRVRIALSPETPRELSFPVPEKSCSTSIFA